jgi:YidC/Oxa1 family membrane protein insertase
MIRIASSRIASSIVRRSQVGALSSVQTALAEPRFERARTFATNSTTQVDGLVSTGAVDDTLDKLFIEQEVSNAVADAMSLSTWDPIWYNVADNAIHTVNAFRDFSGLGYGEAVVGVTVLVRLGLFPLFVKLQRNSARMAHMQPEMRTLKAKLDAMGDNADQETQIKYGLQMRALFKKYECNPFSSLVAPMVQIPVFMGMFFGLRKMPDFFGADLSKEGLFWFSDLTVCDPFYILPVLSATTMLASVELNKDQMLATNPAQGQIMVNVFRAMSIVMVPAIANFPALLNLYWLTNNSITALQATAFRNASIRKALNIWEMPKPVPGMPQPQGIMETIQNTVQRKPSEAEKIKDHNEAVDNKKKVAAMTMGSNSGGTTRGRKKFRAKR